MDLPHTPRYCFGHGLSYTEFAYSNLKIEPKEVAPKEPVRITLTLQNTGKHTGTEVVQLYLSDRYASMTRPLKELQGFQRVCLAPGEQKEIIFTVFPRQMAFLDENMRWKIEKGVFDVQVGSSSEDIRLKGEFCVESDQYVDGQEYGV